MLSNIAPFLLILNVLARSVSLKATAVSNHNVFSTLSYKPCIARCECRHHQTRLSARRSNRLQMAKGFGKSSGQSTPDQKPRVSDREKIDTNESESWRKSIKRSGQLKYENHCPGLKLKYDDSKSIGENKPREVRILHADPPVVEIDNFFSHELCDSFLRRTIDVGSEMSSKTFSSYTSTARTSTTWYFKYQDVPELLAKAYELTGYSMEQYEEPQVVRYEMGQQFSWHYDAIPSNLLGNGGQRLATLIVYLNDVDQGGATCFKDLNIQVKPEKGKALLFFPSFKDGRPDERTLHAGQIAFDTKWIAQIWIHESKYIPTFPPGSSHDEAMKAIDKLQLVGNSE